MMLRLSCRWALAIVLLLLLSVPAFSQAVKLVITGPSTLTAGASGLLTITAMDASNRVATSYNGRMRTVFSGANDSPNGNFHPQVSDVDGHFVPFGGNVTLSFDKGVAIAKGSKNGVIRLFKAEAVNVAISDGTIGSTGDDGLNATVLAASAKMFSFDLQSPQQSGVAFSGTNTILAQDPYGNPSPTFNASTNNVTVTTSLSGQVTGLGTSQNNVLNKPDDFSAGVADLSGKMMYVGDPGTGTFAVAASGMTSASSNTVVMNPAVDVGKVVFLQQPVATKAGSVIVPAVKVQIQDFSNNPITSAGTLVTMTLSDGSGSLKGSTQQLTDITGTATFPDLSLDTPGSKRLTASALNMTSAVSASFTIGGDASGLAIQVQPSSNATAGIALAQQPTVRIVDAAGNLVSTDNTTVVTAARGSGSGVLQGTVSVKAVNGIVAFTDLFFTTAGITSIAFSSAPALTGTTSNSITVSPGPATVLQFAVQPSSVTAGSIMTPAIEVQAQDAWANNAQPSSAITLSLTTGSGILSGTLSKTASTSGRAVFNDIRLSMPGTKQLTASAQNVISAVSNAFTVTAGVQTQLAFVQQPTNTPAGAIITPAVTVQLKDASGNDATTDGISISLSLNGTGTLHGTTTRQTSNGLAVFGDLTIDRGGNKSLVARSTGLTEAQSATFTITAGTATKIRVETLADGTGTVVPAQNLRSGLTLTGYAIGRDASDNFVANVAADTWGLDEVTGGVASADLMPSSDRKSAVLTGRLVGSARIRATFGGADVTPSGVVTVVTGLPASVTANAGTPQSAKVGTTFAIKFAALVRDAAGNPLSGIVVQFAAPTSGASGSFDGGVSTATTDEHGIATAGAFTANATAGSYVVRASIQGVSQAAEFSLTNTAGAGFRLQATNGDGQSASVGARYATRLTVLLTDAASNPVAGATVTFTAPASGASGTFGNSTTDMELTDGSGFASASVFTANTLAGAVTVTATASGIVSPVTFHLTNTAGALARFQVESSQGGAIPNQAIDVPFDIRVTAMDSYTNIVSSFAGTVTISSNGTLAAGSGTTPQFSAGVLSPYTVKFSSGGTYTLTATRTSGSESGTSNSFVVGNPVPVLTTVAPQTGQRGQTLDVVLTGSGFAAGTTSAAFGDGISTSTTVKSSTQLTVNLQIAAAADLGPRNVTVLNGPPGGGTVTLVGAFTVVPNTTPTLSDVTPATGARLQTMDIQYTGTNLASGGRVDMGEGISINSSSVSSSTQATANISISGTAATGLRSVRWISGPDTSHLVNSFAIVNPLPVLSTIDPALAEAGQTLGVTLQGGKFISGVSSLDMGAGISVQSLSVENEGRISATIRIDSTAAAGSRSVTVQNATPGGGTSSGISFSVKALVLEKTIALSNVFDFPVRASASAYQPEDYRIVGLPGASGKPVAPLIPGLAGVTWQMFWDNGNPENYLLPFDAGPVFTFEAGRAFWMVNKGAWTLSTTVTAAPADSDSYTSIALHDGWNLITNPVLTSVSWSKVRGVGGNINDPIYGYDGSFSRSATFEPYVGYYFFNSTHLTSLRVPQISSSSNAIAALVTTQDGWRAEIDLVRDDGAHERLAAFGQSSEAKDGLDAQDYRRPRAMGDAPSVSFARPEWDPRYSVFATDIRSTASKNLRWDFEVTSTKHIGTTLRFIGLEQLDPDQAVILFDAGRARRADLRSSGNAAYSFVPTTNRSEFSIFVGSREQIEKEVNALMPVQVALGPNYPNPFNPSTTIPVTLVDRSDVTLSVCNVVGAEVWRVDAGTLEAGRHVFTWNGKNSLGQDVATGVYLCRLRVGTGKEIVGKMMLMR